jgi:hypothetical protein
MVPDGRGADQVRDAESITVSDLRWSALQMDEVRQDFFCRIGSCSFPRQWAEVEAFGWL